MKISNRYNVLARIRKIPFVDRLILLIFIAILAFATYFFLRQSKYVYITMYVTHNETLTGDEWGKPPIWFTESIKPGIKEKSIFGKDQISVIDVYRYDNIGVSTTTEMYVVLKINSVYNKRIDQYSYMGVPLLVGSYQKFKIQDVVINGIIRSLDMTFTKPAQKSFIVKGFLDSRNNNFPYYQSLDSPNELIATNGIPKSVSAKINEGLCIYDTNQTCIVEIKNATKTPAFYRVPGNGILSFVPDDAREKVEMTVKISADIINGKPYFKSAYPVVINQLLLFHFSDFSAFFTITDIEAVNP